MCASYTVSYVMVLSVQVQCSKIPSGLFSRLTKFSIFYQMHGVDVIFFILSSFVSFFLLSVYTFISSYLSNKEIYGTRLPKSFLTLVYRQNFVMVNKFMQQSRGSCLCRPYYTLLGFCYPRVLSMR